MRSQVFCGLDHWRTQAQLLNLYYVMLRRGSVFLRRQNGEITIIAQERAGRDGGHMHQREILAATTNDNDLLKKVLAAGEVFMNEADH